MPKASELTDQREIISTSEEEGGRGYMRWMANIINALATLDFKLSVSESVSH